MRSSEKNFDQNENVNKEISKTIANLCIFFWIRFCFDFFQFESFDADRSHLHKFWQSARIEKFLPFSVENSNWTDSFKEKSKKKKKNFVRSCEL